METTILHSIITTLTVVTVIFASKQIQPHRGLLLLKVSIRSTILKLMPFIVSLQNLNKMP